MSFAFMPFYTGDYYRDTRHLSMMQHGAYRQLLDHCWDQKGPLPLDVERCYRICGAVSKEEQEAVRGILSEYFVTMQDGHYNRRLQLEIERSNTLSAKRSVAAHERWKARESIGKMDIDASAMQLHSKSNASAMQLHSTCIESGPTPTQTVALRALRKTPETEAVIEAVKPKKHVVETDPAIGSATWEAYSTAYAERYGIAPVRNHKVNSQLKALVARLGADEAPGVARSYLGNRNGLYCSAKHCTDLLLRDAEKLRTEWLTGNVTHQLDAREEDRIGANGAMWERIGKKLEAKGIE